MAYIRTRVGIEVSHQVVKGTTTATYGLQQYIWIPYTYLLYVYTYMHVIWSVAIIAALSISNRWRARHAELRAGKYEAQGWSSNKRWMHSESEPVYVWILSTDRRIDEIMQQAHKSGTGTSTVYTTIVVLKKYFEVRSYEKSSVEYSIEKFLI